MISLISPFKAQLKIAQIIREMRLAQDLTQEGLAERSGVPIATLRKFEQKGLISLESFLKLVWVFGGLEEMIASLKPTAPFYKSIDEVLDDPLKKNRKRGKKK